MTVSLRELQEQFQAYVLTHKENILNEISQVENNTIERIDVYRLGYVLRLLEVLERDYSILRTIIGEDLFEEIARKYIFEHPSNHFSICIFGRLFSQFLLSAGYEAYWSEMAAFEWAIAIALDAPDAPHLTLETLSAIEGEAWAYIQFTLHPSLSFYKFNYNAPQIIHAHMLDEKVIPEVTRSQTTRDWMIWAYARNSYFESLTKEQVWMLNALNQQKTFSQVCEGLSEWLPEEEVSQFAAGSLRNWIEKGIFSAYSIDRCVT